MGINTTKPGEIGIFTTLIASGPVIIQQRDGILKTLLTKHGDKPISELKWKFCGGKVMVGSSLEENAIREAREEIGTEVKLIKPLKPIIVWNEIPETGADLPQAIVLIHYLAEITGTPQAGKEILALEWFDINHLPDDCAPNIKPVITEYLNSF